MTGSTSPITLCPTPVDDPTRRKPVIERAAQRLGWGPSVPIEVGMKQTIDWFRQHPAEVDAAPTAPMCFCAARDDVSSRRIRRRQRLMTSTLTALVTGGSGYIGSHTCVALIECGHDVVVVDDYSNSSPEALARIRDITTVMPTAYQIDIRDLTGFSEVLSRHPIDVVIHFAAKKSVPESTQIPLEYFDVNVAGTINVLRVMRQHGVGCLVYSSSCSVYGDSHQRPLTECDRPAPTNPYAWTKWTCEQIIDQACRYDPNLTATSLRYFNPIGGHPTGAAW